MATLTDETIAKSYAEWVRGRTFGSTRVLDSSGFVDLDADEELAIYLVVTMSDPSAGSETWPIEDVLEIHRTLIAKAAAEELAMPLYVQMRPATDDVPHEDDDESRLPFSS